MRAVSKCFLLFSLAATTWAFAPQLGVRYKDGSQPTMFANVDCDDFECEIPDFDNNDDMGVASLGASVFRNSIVTDVHGNTLKLGERMGSQKSVVVFLRHLG
jgi:hypothetical protein